MIFGSGGIGDHPLAAQIIGHVLAHVEEIPGNQVGFLPVLVELGDNRLVLVTRREDCLEGQVADNGQQDCSNPVKILQPADGNGQIKFHHQVARGDFIRNLVGGNCQPQAVHRHGDKGFFEVGDFAAQLGLCQFENTPLQGVLQPGAVHHGGVMDILDQLEGGTQRIAFFSFGGGQVEVEVHPSHRKTVYLAVQFSVKLLGAAHISAGSNPFNADFHAV